MIPTSRQLRARPVWQRHLRRTMTSFRQLPPPTEQEKADAIRVLEDPENEAIPGLWEEAHRIAFGDPQ